MSMKTTAIVVLAFASTIAFSTPGRSADDFIAAGAAYGGLNQKIVVCYFTNLDNQSVKIKQYRIVNQNGAAQELSNDRCSEFGGVIPAFSTCGIAAVLDDQNNSFHACSALVSVTNKPKLRGALEIRDANQAILSALPLR
jgi:hypothetical protein